MGSYIEEYRTFKSPGDGTPLLPFIPAQTTYPNIKSYTANIAKVQYYNLSCQVLSAWWNFAQIWTKSAYVSFKYGQISTRYSLTEPV